MGGRPGIKGSLMAPKAAFDQPLAQSLQEAIALSVQELKRMYCLLIAMR